jgi:hypothetical protein
MPPGIIHEEKIDLGCHEENLCLCVSIIIFGPMDGFSETWYEHHDIGGCQHTTVNTDTVAVHISEDGASLAPYNARF